MKRPTMSLRRRLSVVAAVTLISVGVLLPSQAIAQDSLQTSSSLRWVPADAAIYMACLRNKEKYDALMDSKAIAALKAMPVVQMGLAQLKEQIEDPENPLFMVQTMLALPENKQLVELLLDMASHEIFIYGDAGYTDAIDLVMQAQSAMNRVTYQRVGAGEFDDSVDSRLADAMLKLLDDNRDKLKVPDTVIGFKIKDKAKAATQLERLEVILTALIRSKVPEIAEGFKRIKVGDSEMLSLRLTGAMLPWDKIEAEENFKEFEGKYPELLAKFKAMTLAVTLGVHEDYVLLSIGDNNDHLAALGKGELLYDRDEMAPLRKVADKRVSFVTYISKDFTKVASSQERSINDLIVMAESLLPLAQLDADLEKEFMKDIKAMAKEVTDSMPEIGAAMGYAYITEHGFEGKSYNWTENKVFDASKKLTILDHLGGDPIFFVAARSRYSPETYQTIAKWAKKAHFYFEQIAMDRIGEEEFAQYEFFRDKFMPLIERFHKATGEMLIPSLKDGQGALVLDAKLKAEQWHKEMPPAKTPVPIPELGIVAGVSDVPLLKKAFSEYVAIVESGIKTAREINPGGIPEFTFPLPESRQFETDSGTFKIYFYKLPSEDLHKWIVPNAGLSDKFAALSVAPLTTKRLLEKRPLSGISRGPLANLDRPLASAAHCNIAGLIDAITPWVDYAYQMYLAQMTELQGDEDGKLPAAALAQYAAIKDQVDTGLKIAKCFRGFSSVVYVEDKAMVTEFEWRFQDLE